MIERMKDLERKEVIDITTGSRIGFISDLEIALGDGRIMSIVVPKGCNFLGWNKEDIIIPWHSIKKIGEDLVIVDTKSCHHDRR